MRLVLAYGAGSCDNRSTPSPMSTTRVSRTINAPRFAVYQALIDPVAVAHWMSPDRMTMQLHEFDPRPGGAVRVTLTYDDPSRAGKSAGNADTYHGHFVTLAPNEQVVETLEFETDDPAMQGIMTVTFTLRDVPGGTEVVGLHTNVPVGIHPDDNDAGWAMAFDKLAAMLGG